MSGLAVGLGGEGLGAHVCVHDNTNHFNLSMLEEALLSWFVSEQQL